MTRKLAILPLILGVACSPTLQAVPSAPSDDPAFVAAAPAEKPGMDESADPIEDIVCAGDVLSVRTFGAYDMGPTGTPAVAGGPSVDITTVLVDRAGRVHLPLLGDIPVGGLSLTQAEARVQEHLSTVDRFGRASLSVAEARGHFAIVTGAVEKTGNVELVGDARFVNVLSAAGGARSFVYEGKFTAVGDVDATRVIRKGVTLPIDAGLAMAGNPRHNVRILPGDMIIVPPAFTGRIAVIGHVGSQRTLAYHRGYRLLEAIADAGGFSADADKDDVRVVRGGYEHPRVFVAKVNDLLAGQRPDVTLAPGDVVFVTQHWTGAFAQIIDQGVPLLSGIFFAEAVTK